MFFILVIILTPSNGGLVQYIKAFSLLLLTLWVCIYGWVYTENDIYIYKL